MKTQVQSPAPLSGLRILRGYGCGVGGGCSSNLIPGLEPPPAAGAAVKRQEELLLLLLLHSLAELKLEKHLCLAACLPLGRAACSLGLLLCVGASAVAFPHCPGAHVFRLHPVAVGVSAPPRGSWPVRLRTRLLGRQPCFVSSPVSSGASAVFSRNAPFPIPDPSLADAAS